MMFPEKDRKDLDNNLANQFILDLCWEQYPLNI